MPGERSRAGGKIQQVWNKKTLQIKDKKDPEIQMNTPNILKYTFLYLSLQTSVTCVSMIGLILILKDLKVKSSQSYSVYDEYLQHSLIFVTKYQEFLNPF